MSPETWLLFVAVATYRSRRQSRTRHIAGHQQAEAPVLSQVLILSITYAVMCYANHVVLAFFAAPLRRALQSPRTADLVRRMTGGLFIGFGAALAASSR